MSTKKPYTFIDLFTGLGGFHLALQQLGCKCVFASELKEDLRKLYQLNFPELDEKYLKVDIVSIATGEIINLEDEPSTSTRQKIKVTFPDGITIQSNKVLETLVEVVKYAGPGRVRDLGITVCADNLVLKTPKPRYAKPCKPVGNGWLVNTCSDTPTKYEQILCIIKSFNLNISAVMI